MTLMAEVLNRSIREGLQDILHDGDADYEAHVTNLFYKLVDKLPVYSGYAAANVRVHVRAGSGQFTSDSGVRGNSPAEKEPWAKRKYLDDIYINTAEEGGKLVGLESTDIVWFTLDIDYDNNRSDIENTFDELQSLAGF